MADTRSARDRLFYSIPDTGKTTNATSNENKDDLVTYIRNNIIGQNKVFSGPFGLREALYLDYTASGKSLKFIEDYIQNEVLPEYGNTHTTSSVTALQTTLYRHEARDIIRNAVHASEHDAVIFVGSGSTGAIHKLIHSLDLTQKPVVFVGPFEHHSNLLPWKESGAKVIRVKADKDGLVDINHLEQLLKRWSVCGGERQLIGCFSAASNITGILVDVDAINILLHKHGALTFWDYATAAPYLKVDMNPVSASADQPYMYKDAVFISCHKFVGGVQTPGLLIAKKKCFQNSVPDGCGGGSVFFVRRDSHRYLQEPEMKEEGGTPAVVEAIRAGMVVQLKEAVSPAVIMQREAHMLSKARAAWSDHPSLILMGNQDVARLPIFSFLVYHAGTGRFLHHNYVSVLLNDLFGIQARGGCACAGPYAMDLLGMEEDVSLRIETLLAEDSRLDRTHLRRYREYSQREILRPGFTRINLPYFLDDDTLDFILEAVLMVAEHGWKLLPQYMFNPETGEWRQKNFQVFKDRKWLGHISYTSGEMKYKPPPPVVKGPLPENYKDCLQKARDLVAQATKSKYQLADHTVMFDEDSSQLRWFCLPSEASDCLQGNNTTKSTQNAFQLPFCPPCLREKIGLPVFVGNSEIQDKEDVEQFMSTSKTCRISINDTKCDTSSSDNCCEGNTDNSNDKEGFSTGLKKCLDQGFASSTDTDMDSEKANCVKVSNQCGPCNETMSCELKSTVSQLESAIIKDESTEIDVNKDLSKSLTVEKLGKDVNKPESGNDSKVELLCTIPSNKKDLSVETEKDSRKRHTDDKTEVDIKRVKDVGKDQIKTGKKKKKRDMIWFPPPKSIFTPFVKAVEEYDMIKDGDKILVCLSGGKDSLSLLHTVRQYQFYCRGKKLKFDIGAVTVDPETPAYDPSPLKGYLASLGVPYFYESQGILEQAANLPYECASICSFCSRMKRGRIYACARREGYNVLALGQHLDDLTESFLMSMFHNGLLRTMKAHYTVVEGDLRVIRPLVYVREKDLRTFAEQNKLPVIAENCPACFEAPKERHRIKQLLAAQEIMFPRIFPSMMSAMKPIMAINKTGFNMADFLHQADDISQDDMEI